MFSQCSVSKVLWRSPLCRRPLLPPTHPLLTCFLRPLLRPPAAPQASQLDKQHLQSLTTLQCLPARRRHGEMLPEQPAVGGRSCCSPHASTSIAPVPARSGSKHTGSGGANYKCGFSICARLRNLVIWKLWVCLLAELSYGMGLETFTVAFIAALLIRPFSVDCLHGKGI